MNKIKLWENGTPYYNESYGQEEPYVIPFEAAPVYDENGNRVKTGCVIVCPGGGYEFHAPHEGAPIADFYRERGMTSFVLSYRVSPYRYPAITEDVLRAVRFVRYHAEKYFIDPEKICVIGFSAGGHLACSSATQYDTGRDDGDEIDKVSSRPNAAILSYAVITLRHDFTHEGTRHNLLNGRDDEEERAMIMSGELAVTEDTPPIFLWHTADDDCVLVENSLNMALALSAKHIPFELHVFPKGPHGLGLSEEHPECAVWAPLSAEWLKRMGF